MQKVKLFQDFTLNEDTPGLNVKAVGVKGDEFAIQLNGHDYTYKAKEDGIPLSEVAETFGKMLKHSSGKALAWLKRNTTLASGSKKNEAEDLSAFGLLLNENDEYVVGHVKMFEQFTNSLTEGAEKDDDDNADDDDDDDATEEEGDEKVEEGLTAKQKKLPKGLQDAILKKQGEKPEKDEKKDDKEVDEKEEKKEKKSEKVDEKKEEKEEKEEKADKDSCFFSAKDVEKKSEKIAALASKLEPEDAIKQINAYLKKHAGELPPNHKDNLKGAVDLLKKKD